MRNTVPLFMLIALLGISCDSILGADFDELQPHEQQPESARCELYYDNDAGLRSGKPASLGDAGPMEMPDGSSSSGTGGAPPIACSTLSNPVFVSGSDSVVPILEQIGPRLAAADATIIYLKDRSCNAVNAIFDKKAPLGIAQYYPACEQGEECIALPCTLDPGLPVDIAVSDIFAATCGRTDHEAAAIEETSGPIQATIFVTAANSSQDTISWEAAHATYDPASVVVADPWDDEGSVLQRITSSGTQRLMATVLKLDPNNPMRGKSFEGSSDLVAEIESLSTMGANAPKRDRILGIYDVVNSDAQTKTRRTDFKTE